MHITDPIADMLTRIRNANSARHDTVCLLYTSLEDRTDLRAKRLTFLLST